MHTLGESVALYLDSQDKGMVASYFDPPHVRFILSS